MVASSSLVSILSLTAAALAAVLPRNETLSADDGATHTGEITFYTPAGGKGACGTPLSDTDAICALSTTLFDAYTPGGYPDGNPNENPLCGRQIQITMDDGSTATVTVADRCEACVDWDLDLTPPTFTSLVAGGEAVGRTVANWQFVD